MATPLWASAAANAANAPTGHRVKGRPPAKRVMPDFSVTLRISRSAEVPMRSVQRVEVLPLVAGRSFGCALARIFQAMGIERGGRLY
ncbi:hypothetical protein D5045_14525 [Verminephrobacter eiseniae]|nr:hypothetical protein [Verminephrobacter eiseniae]